MRIHGRIRKYTRSHLFDVVSCMVATLREWQSQEKLFVGDLEDSRSYRQGIKTKREELEEALENELNVFSGQMEEVEAAISDALDKME